MRLYAEHVRLNQGGYDRHGRYFGQGEKLYRVTDETGYEIDVRVRAPDAESARQKVREFMASNRNLRPVRASLGAAGQEACATMTRLVHLPARRVWVFKQGNMIMAVGRDSEFSTRADAVRAAEAHGLQVDGRGCVRRMGSMFDPHQGHVT